MLYGGKSGYVSGCVWVSGLRGVRVCREADVITIARREKVERQWLPWCAMVGSMPLIGLSTGMQSTGVEFRRRTVGSSHGVYRTVPIGAEMGAPCVRPRISWTSRVAGYSFLFAVFVYLLTGLVCTVVPPIATDVVAGKKIPDDATCLRTSRHTNYIAVQVVMGSPPTLFEMLLRMDSVKSINDTATRLFSNRVAESDTVTCVDGLCTDVALLQAEGPSSRQRRKVVEFAYTNPTTEKLTYGTAVTIGLDGEFMLQEGNEYFITATHICWATYKSADPGTHMTARIVDGVMRASASDLLEIDGMRDTPVAKAFENNACEAALDDVALFPGRASDEAAWLGLASTRAYENSPDGVDDRRVVVEVGTQCAANYSEYERGYSLYQLDCLSVYVSCDTNPSVPFRRLATSSLRVALPIDATGSAHIAAQLDERLEFLPELEAGGDAMWLSLVKLGLMTLAAAVTWMRATKSTSSHEQLFLHCVRMSHCPTLDTEPDVEDSVIFEDAVVGATAIAARVSVAMWRVVTLGTDGQLRAPVAQLLAGILSLVQWVLRYFVLDRRCEAPLTKLGGSTALVDATCAVMLGFAQPPLYVTSISRFDPTARLLTALLIGTLTFQRCLFGAACCGLLWSVASSDVRKPIEMPPTLVIRPGGVAPKVTERFAPEYVPVALIALIMWFLQTASVAILMADVFCTPFAHSMSRALSSGWLEVSFAAFTATAASGLPQLLRTLGFLAQTPVSASHTEKE